jgi:hypothetical protein
MPSNIYVSATRGYKPDAGRNEQEGYRRAQHTWLVSVEPHKHHIPLVPHHDAEPVHYHAVRLDEGDYQVETHAATSDIIGTILVAEGAHSDAKQVLKALEAGLKTAPSQSSSSASEQGDDGESDRWLRKGLHVLQHDKITETFNVGEFMTFAHGYMYLSPLFRVPTVTLIA